MARFAVLPWDSEFFGFRVARISSTEGGAGLATLGAELREAGVELAYWFGESAPAESERAALASVGGILVDEKVTYVTSELRPVVSDGTELRVDSVPAGQTSAALTELAIQASALSRFGADPNIPKSKVAELYSIWMDRSVKRELAFDVLAATSRDDAVAGMVTLGERAGRGDIGLVAVDSRWRGRGVGELMVRAALDAFSRRGFRSVQVVTQGANVAACRLYAKCGFALEQTQFVYHIWPGKPQRA